MRTFICSKNMHAHRRNERRALSVTSIAGKACSFIGPTMLYPEFKENQDRFPTIQPGGC